MPRNWLYYIALVLPIAFRILLLNTGFVEWLWYNHYEQSYYALSTLRVQPQFLSFAGGWQLPAFIITVLCWWQLEESDEGIPAQFLMLPLIYIPFAMIATALTNWNIDLSQLYIYPLVILPFGYAYVIAWTMVIWLFSKLGLTIH